MIRFLRLRRPWDLDDAAAVIGRIDQTTLEAWGKSIGQKVTRPAVLALSGPLGAGKSTLARAIARGAGVVGSVPSPTFNLVLHHDTPSLGAIVHIDLYRIESPDDVFALGWDDLFDDKTIAVIEWPQHAAEWLPADRWHIELGFDAQDSEYRTITLREVGSPPELPALPSHARLPS